MSLQSTVRTLYTAVSHNTEVSANVCTARSLRDRLAALEETTALDYKRSNVRSLTIFRMGSYLSLTRVLARPQETYSDEMLGRIQAARRRRPIVLRKRNRRQREFRRMQALADNVESIEDEPDQDSAAIAESEGTGQQGKPLAGDRHRKKSEVWPGVPIPGSGYWEGRS